jgi:hypothetical protein
MACLPWKSLLALVNAIIPVHPKNGVRNNQKIELFDTRKPILGRIAFDFISVVFKKIIVSNDIL